MPGTRAYSAHICLHVNAPTLCRFAQSYIIHDPFGYEPTINSDVSDVLSAEAMRGGGDVMAPSSLDETDGELPV